MPSTLSDDLQRQLITDLLIESFEGLDRFDRELLALEKGASDAETLNTIFRVIHTIKGTAGCIGLGRIEATAHVGESLLSLVRDGKIQTSAPMISALLALSDALRGMLRHIETHGDEGNVDHTALLARLHSLQSPRDAAMSDSAEVVADTDAISDAANNASVPAPAPASTSRADETVVIDHTASFGLFDDEIAPAPPSLADQDFGLFEPLPSPVTPARSSPPAAPAASASTGAPSPAASPSPAVSPTSSEPDAALTARASISESAIRVEVAQLDKLMNLVGELVLARNQVIQNVAQPDPAALLAASQRLNLITTELQESVMKTRMQPIGNVWAKFPRIVRDLAQELGKKINLVMEGQETELDRTIIEAIKDPLTHIVRNAIDHGLELPATRLAAGKPEEGRLLLRAFHEGGQVNIEFTDDGQGIAIDRVKAKAVQRGLITADQAARLSDREVFHLIFLPGFSTAEKVTNLSGRGVGMDVVKTNIEKIGGSVDVQSATGRGTTLKIKIPLTLAIIPALIVTSGGERFAIPQVNLLELVRVERDDTRHKIETLYNAPVYRLRGRLLPLVDLNRHLRLGSRARTDNALTAHDDAVNIVVLQADGRQFGLVVDTINDTEEIVVKPLGKQLKSLACFAGATIMGDGRVALILDVLGVAQQARVVTEVRDRTLNDQGAAADTRDDRQTLLLFEAAHGRHLALPLSQVARLEELPATSIEYSGGQEVVQYRDQIMPLIRVARFVGATEEEVVPELLQVVVYAQHGRSVGLVVSKISDIVHEALSIQRAAGRPGILGSAVIQQRVTDLLDIEGLIRSADPTFYDVGAN